MDTGKKGRPVSRDTSPETKDRKQPMINKGPDNKKEDPKKKKVVDKKDEVVKDARKGKKKLKEDVNTKKGGKKKKGWLESTMNGCGMSFGIVVLRDPRAIEAANALNLSSGHLRKLKVKFDRIDVDGSGNIDSDEFFEAVGEQRSPLTDRLFAMIDLDGSGTIEFDEYVRVMATYCMFTKDEILRFCFECFDVDQSGTIDEKEFIELCKIVNNAAPAFPNNFKKALEEFDVNEDGLIDYGEFLELDRRYPLILFPAFRLQDTLQRNSLGESQWLTIIEAYNRAQKLEEYKVAHGGRLPPDPLHTQIMKMIMPCLYHERVHIKLGADMESRHRGKM